MSKVRTTFMVKSRAPRPLSAKALIWASVEAVVFLGLLLGCVTTLPGGREEVEMTGNVQWDFSLPISAYDLPEASPESRFGMVEIRRSKEFPVEILLPGGEVIKGSWRYLRAEDGVDDIVQFVVMNTGLSRDPSEWFGRVDAFVSQFGGDRDAIYSWIKGASEIVATGATVPRRVFYGDSRNGIGSEIEVRLYGHSQGDPVEGVVSWTFQLTDPVL